MGRIGVMVWLLASAIAWTKDVQKPMTVEEELVRLYTKMDKGDLDPPKQHTLRILVEKTGQPNRPKAISMLSQAESLWLSDEKITDIEPLGVLKNLQRLSLEGNAISDISPLGKLKSLKLLLLSSNAIQDLSPLKGCPKLEELRISDNRIRDISILKNHRKLGSLWMDNNGVEDLSPLKPLSQLWSFTAYGNPIKQCPETDAPAIVTSFCKSFREESRKKAADK